MARYENLPTGQARRIRDLLRTELLAGGFADGHLPSEDELTKEFQASRATIRSALEHLTSEGLIVRRRGVGTLVNRHRTSIELDETHGVVDPQPTGIWSGAMRTEIISWGDCPAGAVLAGRLGITHSEPLLRIDYIAVLGTTKLGTACNYVRYPQAARLTPQMFGVDWYRMLGIAGIEVGSSAFLFDAATADEHDAAILGVEVGEPMLLAEQVIQTPDGDPFDIAYLRNVAHRAEFVSHWRSKAQVHNFSAR